MKSGITTEERELCKGAPEHQQLEVLLAYRDGKIQGMYGDPQTGGPGPIPLDGSVEACLEWLKKK